MAGTRRLTLREPSEELGVSVEAVRKGVKRGSLRSGKGPDGRAYVYLDAGGDASHPQAEVEGSGKAELIGELRDRISYLEGQLDIRTEELKKHLRLLAGLIERVPELEAPNEAGEQPGASETVEEEPEGAGSRSTTPGAQEDSRRPWWHRIFGEGR